MSSKCTALYHYVANMLSAKMDLLECMYVQQAFKLITGLLPDSEDGNKSMKKSHLERCVLCDN